MSEFHIKRQRKVHHCLIFDRKSSNTALTPRQRIAMFQGEKSGASNSAGEERNSVNSNGRISQANLDYLGTRDMYSLEKRQRKKTLEELAIRKTNIEQTLKRRRNGICNEIERNWFLQGAHLEKHRHNLQVTHELMARGLMWS
ncbi:hypothetical protein OS493_000012 [Desmophyllum pertusum]|uniref:Uncharacterized protein n=1 Tax=Desmophyllum pertusum TaxID=174260 RepID=A0A9X0A6P7_9CNID|nr:hypothetical protein OS493_000012 [Desmophyllum pertusum]